MAELTKIKDQLLLRLSKLQERSKGINDDLCQPHDDDFSEDAVESENDEVLEKIGNMANDEMKKIKLALVKIENGSYGKCTECDTQISINRLEALPFVSKCIECAEEE